MTAFPHFIFFLTRVPFHKFFDLKNLWFHQPFLWTESLWESRHGDNDSTWRDWGMKEWVAFSKHIASDIGQIFGPGRLIPSPLAVTMFFLAKSLQGEMWFRHPIVFRFMVQGGWLATKSLRPLKLEKQLRLESQLLMDSLLRHHDVLVTVARFRTCQCGLQG